MKKKWRPRLSSILILINLVILVLPLGGIAVLRVYESALIRQTESELIAQGVFVSATYRTLFHDATSGSDDSAFPLSDTELQSYGIERQYFEPKAAPDGPWRPRLVKLDLARDAILPRVPSPMTSQLDPDPISAAVGRRLEPILRDAQVNTLAGIRVVDYRGVIVATTGSDLGESILNREETLRALSGEYVSLMRRRGQSSDPAPLNAVSRGARIRVSVSVPILMEGRVIGAVTLLRTPANISQAIRGKKRELMLGGAALVMIVLGLTLFTSVTIGRPVRALIAQARRAARGEAGAVTPLKHSATREIAELSHTVAAMARTLEERASYIRDLAAHISHEFKTPLTAIRGTVELMRDHGDAMQTAEREKFLNILDADAERLDRLVRRLLELARADMSATSGEAACCEPEAVIAALVAQYRARQYAVTLSITQDLPAVALSADMLDSILGSLLDNAFQHAGSSAQVHIDAAAVDEGVRIRVSDDGSGISAHNAARIFEPFFTTARSAGNTGMGLSIVRSLLQAHGGEIRLRSPSSGTCFQMDIPTAP